ncbi:MAG: murein biosynthesis integral membrane protein MurJ [Planctomycetes bacterium]|nr:murein biosynthesis integral membrane protein MurJ [Planctomycetota bacterium]
MAKGFRQIASLTLLSRVLGMVRDMTFAHFLGLTLLMDMWVIAFKIPNLARRIFGEGALSSALIPIYIEELQRDRSAADRLANTVLTALVLSLGSLVLLGQAALLLSAHLGTENADTGRMLTLAATMPPYMVMICSVAAIAGILQAHRHFVAPALAPVVLNVVVIGSFWISGWYLGFPPERQLGVAAIGVLVAGGLQLLLQVPALRAHGFRVRPSWQFNSVEFRRVMLLMGPMVLGLTVTQINTLADDVIAKALSGPPGESVLRGAGWSIAFPVGDGAVSSLFYSQRLYQFPLGVLGISLATAIFPVMSSDAARGDHAALCRTLSRGMRSALCVAIPATAGLWLVGRPLVSAIFQHGEFAAEDSSVVAGTLAVYAIGLSGYFMQQIITRAYFALQDSKMPLRSAIIAVSVNIVLNLTLIWPLGTRGLALATAVCSYLQVAILVLGMRRRFGRSVMDGVMKVLCKTAVASLVMIFAGCVIRALMAGLPETRLFDMVRVFALVVGGGGVFWAAGRCLHLEEVQLLFGKSAGKRQD